MNRYKRINYLTESYGLLQIFIQNCRMKRTFVVSMATDNFFRSKTGHQRLFSITNITGDLYKNSLGMKFYS